MGEICIPSDQSASMSKKGHVLSAVLLALGLGVVLTADP